MDSVFGKKLSMTQRYDEKGVLKTVTRVMVEQHTVTGQRTKDKNGYDALQIGIGSLKKPIKALSKAYDDKVPQLRKEIRTNDLSHAAGEVIKVGDVLKAGDLVKVTGFSKGKGFTGVVKRHGFAGGPKTHGQSDRHRAPGSIGAGTTMGRVLKGLRMAGRSGNEQSAVRNLTVMYVREDGTVYLSGPIPGHLGTVVKIDKLGENKKFSAMVLTAEDAIASQPGNEKELVTDDKKVETEKVAETSEKEEVVAEEPVVEEKA